MQNGRKDRELVDMDRDRFRGCLLGLAVGDAVGTTLEFKERGSFVPVKGMMGGGPFGLRAGQWTDDTSMALCLATSLIAKNGFDATDQMDRYWDWYTNGYLSSTGQCFDIGNTVRKALEKYKHTGEPFSGSTTPTAAGNGSLMRLAPIPLFYFPNLVDTVKFARESSRTTHAALECVEACELFAEMIFRALYGLSKDEILLHTTVSLSATKIRDVAAGSYREKPIDVVRGSGYVVESLEAALWCFYRSNSFEAAVLQAANLGEDADTTAAICGQIAGAHYGESGIPLQWLEKLCMRAEISDLAVKLSRL